MLLVHQLQGDNDWFVRHCLHQFCQKYLTLFLKSILLEKTTLEKSNDKSFPTDAFNVTYIVDGETYLDVTRSGKMVNVFDMYCDRYGKTSVQKIDFGFGSINPSQYGYKSPDKKKRRKV